MLLQPLKRNWNLLRQLLKQPTRIRSSQMGMYKELDPNNGAEEIVGVLNGLTISLNANATNGIVTELVQQIRIDGVTNGAINDEADVTVTITDADGDSTSFTRQVDSDGAEGFTGMADDDREVEASTYASGVVTD